MSATIEVKVIPRAKRNEIFVEAGRLVVRVTAPANDDKANAAALKLLANHLGLAASRLEIIRGQRSRHKSIRWT